MLSEVISRLKDKVTITGIQQINYLKNLIEIDIRNIEANLNAKQKLLQLFKEREKNAT